MPLVPIVTESRKKEKKIKEPPLTVSMTPRIKRITLSKVALDVMVKNYKRQFSKVVVLEDTQQEKVFWIKPCTSDERGARSLGTTGKYTKSLCCSKLFRKLNWLSESTRSTKFPVLWDKKNSAIKVEFTKNGD